ncbi:MAG TPA: lysophospholipid acyltransferase family protein [Baekduia sp.]|nr:lysophospholipid acyltransferase family protein [Baekduia sp.]
MSPAPSITRAYRLAMAACTPFVRWWGRLEVTGLECVPASGPLLIVGNHDSYWDPVAIGIAGLPRRQIQALAKSSLWKVPGLSRVLDGMGQIPIVRGAGDGHAMDRAIEALRAGACIGVFPEGTRSLGRELRARSGLGRLAEAVPEAEIVCVAVQGTVDIPRFPKRPRVRVHFFQPAEGRSLPSEDAKQLPVRLLAEIRALAPIAAAGRRPRPVESAEPAPAADAAS